LDVTPASIGDAVDPSQHRLKVARDAVQGELAPEAQLVIVGLHTLQQPTFTTGDVATEILQVGCASPFYRLYCCG